MTAKLLDFPIGLGEEETRLSLDPDKLLTEAMGELTRVVIIGEQPDGSFYFASSEADGPSVLWALAMAKKRLLDISS